MQDISNWPLPDYTVKFGLSAVVVAHTEDPQTTIVFMTNRPAMKLDELNSLPIADRPRSIRSAVWGHDLTAGKIMANLRISLKPHVVPEHHTPVDTLLINQPVESVVSALNAAVRKVGCVVWHTSTVSEASERGLFHNTSPVGTRPRTTGAFA